MRRIATVMGRPNFQKAIISARKMRSRSAARPACVFDAQLFCLSLQSLLAVLAFSGRGRSREVTANGDTDTVGGAKEVPSDIL